jgi:hypothetical protein
MEARRTHRTIVVLAVEEAGGHDVCDSSGRLASEESEGSWLRSADGRGRKSYYTACSRGSVLIRCHSDTVRRPGALTLGRKCGESAPKGVA